MIKSFPLTSRRIECQVPESPAPAIVSGVKYNEWQRNSGLRVLRKVLDRQKLLEFESLNVVDKGGGRRKLSQVLKATKCDLKREFKFCSEG